MMKSIRKDDNIVYWFSALGVKQNRWFTHGWDRLRYLYFLCGLLVRWGITHVSVYDSVKTL